MRYRCLSLVLVLLALAGRTEATTTYYVAIGQSGADNVACDGLSPTNTGGGHCPFKDLTSAAVRAKVTNSTDVRVEFRTGTYDVGASAYVVQGAGGSWSQATVVTSYRAEAVTFTGTYTARETIRISGTYVEVSNVTIIRAAAYNVEHRGGSHSRLRFNVISDNFDSDLIKVDGNATDVDISSNEMTQWVSQAIDIAGATGTVVEGNYMHDPKVSGQPAVGAKFEAVDVVVRSNVIVGSAVGVAMGGSSTSHSASYEALRMVVEANSFSSLTGVAFVLYSCVNCVIKNNHVWSGIGGVRLTGIATYVTIGGCNTGAGCVASSGLTASGNTFQSLSASPNNSFWIVDSTEIGTLASSQNNYCTQAADATARFGVDGSVLTSIAAWQAATGTDTQSRVLASTDARCAAQPTPTATNPPFVAAPAYTYFTGTVYTAATCERVDVQAKMALAADHDIVQVPAGTCTWATPGSLQPAISISGKGVMLRGAGAGQTVITDSTTSSFNEVAILIDNALGKTSRVTGFTFIANAPSKTEGIIKLTGGTHTWRIDHTTFDGATRDGNAIVVRGETWGVADHNTFLRGATGNWKSFQVSASNDTSWSSAVSLGTANATYVEDNTFTYSPVDGGDAYRLIDTAEGARVVWRYNTMTNTGDVGSHGYDSDPRAMVSLEVYGNSYIHTVTGGFYAAVAFRGGTGMVFDNAFTETAGGWNAFVALYYYCSCPFDCTHATESVYPGKDQPGRAPPGSTGATQTLAPIYEFNNTSPLGTRIATGGTCATEATMVQANRDYFSKTASFDGTVGVGSGPRASRPATCAVGVTWWATDQGGNWNTANSSANDGTLDKCTAANTWTDAFYTPYTYPLPLASGS